MKALSLKQPWLYAITHLGKTVENRTWQPPGDMVGQWIALHASKTKSRDEWVMAESIHGSKITTAVPVGKIVAVAKIDRIETLMTTQQPVLKWFFGPYGWILDPIRLLNDPIPARGMLGLWEIPYDITSQIRLQMGALTGKK